MAFFSDIKPVVWLVLAGSVFILVGLAFVWLAIKTVCENLDSQKWPQTVATLQDIEVIKHIRERDAEGNYRQYISYLCGLTYEYRVGGQRFTAQIRKKADNREDAVRIAASHSVSEMQPIYYNHNQPDRHRFELASPFAGLLWLLPFAGFAAFGSAIIYVGNRFYGQ